MTVRRLGARCDLVADESTRLSFSVAEFADLQDGRRVMLHQQRGFSIGGAADVWDHLTPDVLRRDVLTTVLPDDDEPADEHPYEWLVGLLAPHGVGSSVEELRRVPYVVEFSDRLSARLARPH